MPEDRITPYQAEREVSGIPEHRIFTQVMSDAKTLLDTMKPDQLFPSSRHDKTGDILATARLHEIDTKTPQYADVVQELRWYWQQNICQEYIPPLLEELENCRSALEEIAHKSGQQVPRIRLI